MNTLTWRSVPVLALLLSAGSAFASLTGMELGTSAPPSTLGSFDLTPFTADPSALGAMVTSVALPADATPTGSLLFDVELEHRKVGSGWATWSHGYTGDVYWNDVFLGAGPGGSDTVTITLPADTKAFYFYVQPDFKAAFDFNIAVGWGGGTMSLTGVSVNGNAGAKGFAFYATAPGDPSITSIAVTGLDTWPDGYAIGEFGINGTPTAPDGGATLALLGVPLLVLALLRRRSSR